MERLRKNILIIALLLSLQACFCRKPAIEYQENPVENDYRTPDYNKQF